MQLIQDFQMPSFTRLMWVSPEAQADWEPTIQNLSLAYRKIEVLSVIHGVRRAFTTLVSPNDFVSEAKKMAAFGLVLVPLQRVVGEVFSHRFQVANSDNSWKYYCVGTHTIELANQFIEAYNNEDHKVIGALLGYPECCSSYFERIWSEGYFDPVWQIALNTLNEVDCGMQEQDQMIQLKTLPEMNVLLRYIGLRTIPHIPHSLMCSASIGIASLWKGLAEIEGLGDEWNLVTSMLGWPLEWTVLHGIAEVRTPVFKLSVSSIPTYTKYTVRLEGISYPEEGAKGLYFPYVAQKRSYFAPQV